MSQEPTSLIAVEEGEKLGAHAVHAAVVMSLAKTFGVPMSALASNVRSAMRPVQTTVFLCQGVVSREPLVYGESMVLVESAAPLLGFYNNGYDEERRPVLVAAYGKPTLVRAWNVMVGSSVNPTTMNNVVHYQDLILYINSNFDPKTTKPVEKA